jgi:hypothetical protein
MKKIFTPIVGFAAGALILAGCSGGGSGTTTDADTSAQPSAAPSGQAQGPGQNRQDFGVSGEIVYAQDGTLQVQNSQSQTAVRYTDATTVEQQVTVALADVSVGSCVVAIVGEDGTATTVRVTQPVDGECSTGFGQGGFPGGGGAPGGDMPSGAPTALPDGGAMPSGAPTDFPSGAPGDGQFPGGGQGGFGGTFVTGTVASVSDSGLTVTTDDGSTDVPVGTDTSITGTEAADQAAIAVGLCLTAQGAADDAGGFDATSITVSAKGDDGCSSGFGGMGGSRPDRGGQGDQNGGSNG